MRLGAGKFLLAFAVLVLLGGAALGQASVSGSISGTVQDATGGVIPGVEVTIVNQDTGAVRTVITDDSGFYTAPVIPVGNYTVEVAMPGFRISRVTDVRVDIRANRVIDHTLQVGDVTQEVTVEAASMAQVELRSGEVSSLITADQISELPLNARSFVQLSLLVPGASIGNTANVRFTGLFAGVDISFSGSASNANMWLVDGTNNVDLGSGRTILTYPSVDSIAEFKIHRNMYGADLAASSGAQINVVTKSGTNEFHGSIYHFHRNSVLNATDFFLNRAGQDKQPLVYNNFGYTLGGPIVKDRAFFFWSQEWRRERRGVPRQNLVPTMLERQGDFSGPNSRYADPLDPLTGELFPDNRIPADRLSPAGLALMRRYPVPTIAVDSPAFGGFNWVAAPSTPIDTRQEQIRADWIVNDQHSVMGRVTLDTWGNRTPSYIEGGLWGDDPFPALDSDWDQPGRSVIGQWTATFGPTMVNQVSFSWSGNEIIIERGAGDDINSAINAAMPQVFPGPQGHASAGFWGDPLGNSLWHQAPWQNQMDLYVWKDDFSKVVGDHSVKAGFLMSRNRKDEDLLNNSQAHAPFYWGPTAVPGGAGLGGGWGPAEALGNGGIVTGNGVADMLLQGAYWGGGTEFELMPRVEVRWRDYEGYINDTWRVSPRVTLNYGARWSYLPNPYDRNDRIGNFVLALYNPAEGAHSQNGMIYPGDIRGQDVNERSLVRNHFFDISPRFGVAWDPTGAGKWAIRSGAGVFFNREAVSDVMSMQNNPPFQTIINPVFRAFDWLPIDYGYTGGEGLPETGKDLAAKTPGSYQWNLTIERELMRDTKLEVAYVANRGHHIPTQFYLNQVPPQLRVQYAIWELDGDPATSGHILRPLFDLKGSSSTPLIYSRSADSWYHSFQAYLVKRFSNRFSYQASYTFSKFLSTAGGLGHVSGNTISDPANIKYDKGRPNFDRPHIFTGNLIYQTPALADRSGFAQAVLGNWETAFITTFNSGVPVTVTTSTVFTGTQSNRPDQIAGTEGPKTVDQWFNINAFRPSPVLGQLGKSARGQIRGPGIANIDFSIMKNFVGLPWFTAEGATLQFRSEFFNLLNKTQFQTIDAGFPLSEIAIDEEGNLTNYVMTNDNFGRVSAIRQAREIQFAFKIMW
jgi:hypothetical protein